MAQRRADLEAIMAKNAAATKRNNRKIHARKFLATPEGRAWRTEEGRRGGVENGRRGQKIYLIAAFHKGANSARCNRLELR
jgi:hypothetical protein